MSDHADWNAASWEGSRRLQQREFLALSLREKLAVIEQLGEVAEFFGRRRRMTVPKGGEVGDPPAAER
jgi:hypothetical protein